LRKFTRMAVEDEVHKRRLTECESDGGLNRYGESCPASEDRVPHPSRFLRRVG
jgi:hypothetical protein